jgi:hypothetical protein
MKYRSKFEARFAKLVDGKVEYESVKLKYKIPESSHVYTPDFSVPGTNILIETKGRWDAKDRAKHILVKSQHPEKRIILVFQNPNCTITQTSKTRYCDWCKKNGIEWMSIQEALELILKQSSCS